jgi:transposase
MFSLGIDVSKAKLDCCLLLDPLTLKTHHKSLPNTPESVTQLLRWVTARIPADAPWQAVMEATGVYHEAFALALHDAGFPVVIANPAQIRKFADGLAIRSKTDRLDSVVLARFGHERKPNTWTPPAPEVRTLTQLLARFEALSADLQRERNRLEKATATPTDSLVHSSLQQSITFLQQQVELLQKAIDDHIDRHPRLKQDKALLASIPAVGERTSTYMTMLFNKHRFSDAAQAAAFLGLTPVEHQSGSSIRKRARLSKAGHARLRAILYMAAVVAIRHNPDVKVLYLRLLAKGKCKMSALGASMRKLVQICYGVIKHQTPYQQQTAS